MINKSAPNRVKTVGLELCCWILYEKDDIMIGKALSLITAIIISLTCFSSCSSSESDNASQQITTHKETPMTTITEETTTATTTAKPADSPVPDKIKEMLEYTEPDYRGQPGGPAAAFMTYYGYRGHEGAMQDEMWFQDMDGDNIPDLVVGGYSAIVDGIQGRTHCFQIQLSKGNGGGTIHLLLDYSSKDKHGHDAFMMQAYKDNNGSLLFTHTDFYAYTSPDPESDPKYAGAFTIFEYSFAKELPEDNKKKILYYTYNPKLGSGEDAFSCSDSNGSRITAANAKKLFNNYYASKTPLKANIKTINYQNYMNNMSQEQRKQALMDSYYAFSYTQDKTIKPYGKEVFDKMPSAAATAATTTTTTKKPQQTGADIYASYSAVLSGAKNRMPNALDIAYMVFDYDKDGKDELIIHYLTGARIGEAEIYEYDSNIGKSVLEAQGPCLALLDYSDKTGGLITSTVSNMPVKPNSPSGASVVICKIIVSGRKISYESLAQLDPDLDKKQISEYTNSKKEFADAGTNGSANAVKANAVKNKAA